MSANNRIDESTSRLARNNLTSRVWDYFQLQRCPPSGPSEEETYKAVCNNCGQIMSYDPKYATTTHLRRHIKRNICSNRAAASARRHVVAAPAANEDSQAAAEAFADSVWADGDDLA